MWSLDNLDVKLFADGADAVKIAALCEYPWVRGFTTNPTLMRQAGVTDYEGFARAVLETVGDRPISFEVFADDENDMEWQARLIASWGSNVYVKIPVTNTTGESTADLIARLSHVGVKLNVTAVLTLRQVKEVAAALTDTVPSFISIFAGRIADTGRDPVPLVAEASALVRSRPNIELIWASSRELLNIVHAQQAGCHIITVTPEILGKLSLFGKDLDEYSRETVQMFYSDAQRSGLSLAPAQLSGV